MTAAPEALHRLVAHGFQIEAHNGKLRIHPADRLTPEQRDWISAHKAEWLALLTASNDSAASESGESVTPQSENFADIDQGEIQSEPPHKMYERPLGDRVRCVDCRHGIHRPGDEPGAWRTCNAGQTGHFANAMHFCEKWEMEGVAK